MVIPDYLTYQFSSGDKEPFMAFIDVIVKVHDNCTPSSIRFLFASLIKSNMYIVQTLLSRLTVVFIWPSRSLDQFGGVYLPVCPSRLPMIMEWIVDTSEKASCESVM